MQEVWATYVVLRQLHTKLKLESEFHLMKVHVAKTTCKQLLIDTHTNCTNCSHQFPDIEELSKKLFSQVAPALSCILLAYTRCMTPIAILWIPNACRGVGTLSTLGVLTV